MNTKTNNLLVICPTRGRPITCARMIKSFKKKTSSEAHLVFIIDDDDKDKEEYLHLFKHANSPYIIRRYHYSICDMHNILTTLIYPDYKYYSITCDDFIYHTGEWDNILINKLEEKGGGIAYGDDGYEGAILPTTCIISSNIIKALGWIVLPTLKYLCGDLVWREIGRKLNCLYYIPEVKIEHMTPLARKAEVDDTHRRTNNIDMYIIDNKSFREWQNTTMAKDIEKIRKGLQ